MTKDKNPGVPKVKKEGWRDRTKELKTLIIKDPKFEGLMFMLGQVPLRKIGVQRAIVAIPGTPTHEVVNASHHQAPPYRIVFTNKGVRCYVKGTTSVIVH